MGWRMMNSLFLSYFPDNPGNPGGNWHEYFPTDIVAVTKNALPPGQRSAQNIVDFWVNQFLGYDASSPGSPQINASVRSMLIQFMQQDAPGAASELDLDADGWDNTTWMAYVPQRLQTLVASISMQADNMLR
jgi:hypothetical protein